MSAQELLDELQTSGAKLVPQGDRLRIEAPKGMLTDQLLEQLTRYKLDLLRLLQLGNGRDAKPAAVRVVAEYRFAGSKTWLVVLGAQGETYEELVQSLRRRFNDVDEIRPYRGKS